MERNENTGSVPDVPETTPVMNENAGPGDAPKEQPVTVAGGGLGPLETAIEKAEEDR